MGLIKQSICFGCFNRSGVSPEMLIKAATKIGYDSVEMLPREHWNKVLDAGMKIAIVLGHASLPDGLNKIENHNRIEDELLANIDLAVEYKIPSLICFSGNREDKTEEEGLENCVEGLSRVVKTAEEKGVNLCMELLNSKVDHPDYQCDRTEWGVSICQKIGSPRVKLLYDIYHMQIMEGDLIRTIRKNIDYIGHFHTAGNPGRNDLDENQEIYYPPIIHAISETSYEGYIGHEFVPLIDPIVSMKETYDTCNV